MTETADAPNLEAIMVKLAKLQEKEGQPRESILIQSYQPRSSAPKK
jgi:hypothetical protein